MLVSAWLFAKKGGLSALCLIALTSFISFFAIYYSSLSGDSYYLSDSIRISAIIAITCYCGALSVRPFLYLVYAVVLFCHLIVNFIEIFNHSNFHADYYYLTITIIELLLFCSGCVLTHRARSGKSALYDNNALDIDDNNRRRNCVDHYTHQEDSKV